MLHVVALGNFRRASRLARQVVRASPSHRVARLILGLSKFRAGQYAAARSHFTKPSKIPLAQLTSVILSAWSYVGERKVRKALATLDALKSSDSLKTFYLYHRALIADAGRLSPVAGDAYAKAYKRNSGSVRMVQAYGRFLERSAGQAKAGKIFDTFLKKNPSHPLIIAARKRLKTGKKPPRLVPDATSGAAELLFGVASLLSDDAGIDLPLRFTRMALFMRPNFVLARVLAGDVFQETRRYESAVAEYDKVPSASLLRRNADIQAAASLNRLKKHDEAEKRLKGVIGRYPSDFEPVMVLADMLRTRSKFKQAAEYYSQAIKFVGKLERRHWQLLYHRGIAHERAKIWPRAEEDFKKALELFPDQPLVLNYLGYSWVEQRQNLKTAMAMIRKAVKLRSNDGFIVDSLGWAHFQLGEYEKAVTALEKAVKLMPQDPILNDHLGDAYWRVGRKLEARFQWSHARDLKPEPDALKKILEKIKSGMPPVPSSNTSGDDKPKTAEPDKKT